MDNASEKKTIWDRLKRLKRRHDIEQPIIEAPDDSEQEIEGRLPPIPSRDIANATCLDCNHFVKIDPDLDTTPCPFCGKTLNTGKAIALYDSLFQAIEDGIREVKNDLPWWKYYIKKIEYYWNTSLLVNSICLPIIACVLLLYLIAPGIYENPIVSFIGGAAAVVEILWLFVWVIGFISDNMRDNIARAEYFGFHYKPKYKTQKTILVAFGLIVIVGCFATDKAFIHPSDDAPATSETQAKETASSVSEAQTEEDGAPPMFIRVNYHRKHRQIVYDEILNPEYIAWVNEKTVREAVIVPAVNLEELYEQATVDQESLDQSNPAPDDTGEPGSTDPSEESQE